MQKLLEELFQNYYPAVYGYLYSLCRDAALAEDLASEVFLEVVRSALSFRGESDVKTWLFSIARHRWLHYLRQKTGLRDPLPLTDFLPDGRHGPEDTACQKALLERLDRLLQTEPPRTQTIVKLRMSGFSFYEIGTQCGLSENSARVLFFRTKQKLCQALKKEGFDL